MLTAEDVIRILELVPHPEGGHYRETFRDAAIGSAGRAASTAIYFLLRRGEASAWHRIDACEVWHWYAGATLRLEMADQGGAAQSSVSLGPGLDRGERPQVVVPAGFWQRARSTGAWTLVGCTVAPGFRFEGFQLDVGGSLPVDWR